MANSLVITDSRLFTLPTNSTMGAPSAIIFSAQACTRVSTKVATSFSEMGVRKRCSRASVWKMVCMTLSTMQAMRRHGGVARPRP